MKKKYITPEVERIDMELLVLQTGSPWTEPTKPSVNNEEPGDWGDDWD